MIDALLFAVRDGIRGAGFGYNSAAECEIMDSGMPPQRCGSIFVAVHEGSSRSTATRNLDERFGFNVTLTMRVSVPLDRVGDQLMASKLARTSGKGQPSFNARIEQLRAYLHMNWTVCVGTIAGQANGNLAAWTPSGSVYGFVEPAQFTGREMPQLVGGEWFGAAPDAKDVGLKCELRFDGARRMQPQTAAVGPNV